MKAQYELSLAQYEWLYNLFLEQSELHHKLLNELGDRYAPDLSTIGQKRIRVRNGAIRYAVTMFMRHYQMGVTRHLDMCEDGERARHYNVGIGDVIGTYYRTNKDYEACKVFLMRELRSMAVISSKAIW